jgi:hypothetical protein
MFYLCYLFCSGSHLIFNCNMDSGIIIGLGLWLFNFQQYSSFIVAVSFIGGGTCMMFLWFNSNTTGASSGSGTAHFNGVDPQFYGCSCWSMFSVLSNIVCLAFSSFDHCITVEPV